MKNLLFAIIFLILSSPSLKGQLLNVDTHEIYTDTAKYITGSIGLKFHLDNKNATVDKKNSFIVFENKNDLVFVGLKNNYLISSHIRYFNSSGGTFISSGQAHGRANLSKMRKVSYEIFSQAFYDRNRFLDYRFLLGAGIRIRIASTENLGLFVGSELMYEHEKWDNPENETQYIIKDLPKFGFYANFRKKISDVSTFRILLIYQTGFDPDPGLLRNRLSIDAQFDIQIFRRLYFTVKFVGSYEDEPIYPINKYVYSFENGLAFKF